MRRLLLTLALGGAALAELPAQDKGADRPAARPPVAIPLTDDQKAALHAVDVRIAGVETLLARIDDPAYRAKEAAAVADLKRRRAALEKKFDPGLQEALMHSVISRYQIIALWLAPPRDPAPKPAAPSPAR